jgi:hypothetical protein
MRDFIVELCPFCLDHTIKHILKDFIFYCRIRNESNLSGTRQKPGDFQSERIW